MVMSAPDRVQLTLPAGAAAVKSLIQLCPPTVDLVLLETHSPEPYPTILCESLSPALDEDVIARWKPGASFDTVAVELAPALLALLPADRELDLALRAAMILHRGHACAGLVLGTRLALHGARALDVPVPDVSKRLIVLAETDRCAVDAIQAVTGCRPGKRTLRILDYGKLAATFIDQRTGAAVRVATRGDLRERAGTSIDSHERHGTQRAAYLAMRGEELFTTAAANCDVDQFDLPGPPRRRVNCGRCGEEVSDGREITTESGPWCRPCAMDAPNNRRNDGGTA
jgi:formylmethanofuran dehydrogenase subunit E